MKAHEKEREERNEEETTQQGVVELEPAEGPGHQQPDHASSRYPCRRRLCWLFLTLQPISHDEADSNHAHQYLQDRIERVEACNIPERHVGV
eukprot:scaffold3183_cov381-Prasinococcus_capsulatus_cf.AAC.13